MPKRVKGMCIDAYKGLEGLEGLGLGCESKKLTRKPFILVLNPKPKTNLQLQL